MITDVTWMVKIIFDQSLGNVSQADSFPNWAAISVSAEKAEAQSPTWNIGKAGLHFIQPNLHSKKDVCVLSLHPW